MSWQKSSYCADTACVEVSSTVDPDTREVTVLLRDSKNPDAPALAFTMAEWEAFLAGVKDGEFDG